MSKPITLSVDAMGGDFGPTVVVPGLALNLRALGHIRFLLHGDQARIEAELRGHPDLAAVSTLCHTDLVISSEEKPAVAMRRGKGSSLWNTIESVKSGVADAAVSAGNTGALMAISKLQLRMSANLERPAIVAAWPTARGSSAVLDLGANVQCHAEQLVEFAVMGAAFHHAVLGSHRPSVGILNVGSEDEKGHEEVREAARILKSTPLDFDFHGFVEGNDIAKGTVDVVVTDGFTGNVALKTAEGLARFFADELKAGLTSGPFSMLGAFLAQKSLRRLKARMDPGAVNGGPLLGLNGIVVKSHGGADASGFSSAVRVAAELARSNFSAEIRHNFERLKAVVPAIEAPVELASGNS